MPSTSPSLPWTRLWYPSDATPATSDGYLDPRSQGQGATLADLSQTPCLVLLGEPGMGKSYEARQAYAALIASGVNASFVAPAHARDPEQVLNSLLDSVEGRVWRTLGLPWHVFVDGVDEIEGGAGAFFGPLRAFLTQAEDNRHDLTGLHLRLLCRTGEWSQSLDRLLTTAFREPEIQKRQLAPLGRQDVERGAALQLGDDAAGRLLSAIDQAGLAPLAARPVSNAMLTALFAQEGRLPKGQADIFLDGLRRLLGQPRRLAPLGTAASDTDRLLTVSARIAAAMVLSDVNTLSLGARVDGSLVLEDLAGGLEPAAPHSFEVTTGDLADAVRTPLFVSIGPDLFAWSHQAMAEFLAARYLVEHQLTPEAILDLLQVADPDGRAGIPPQHREVAAWTATMLPGAFDLLLRREPDVLLQSDMAGATAEARQALTAALLDRFEAGEMADQLFALRPRFDRLDHPGLADQLAAVIADRARGELSRRAAIDIAEANQTQGLTDFLGALLEDPSEPLILRRKAAGALAHINEPAGRTVLARVVARDPAHLDDEIRGAALGVLWPDALGIADLLAALTPAQDTSFIGFYASFLYQLEPRISTPPDAVAVLTWLAGQTDALDDDNIDFTRRRVLSRLFWAAAAHGDDSAVRAALGGFIAARVDALTDSQMFTEGAPKAWPGAPADKVAIVLAVLAQARDAGQAARFLRHFVPGLVAPEDLDFYVAGLAGLTDPTLRAAFAELVIRLSAEAPIDTLSTLYDLAQADPALAAVWQDHYAILLDAPAVEWLRRGQAREAAIQVTAREQAGRRQEADAAALELLARIEAGEPDAWWHLNLQLFVSDEGQFRRNLEFESDLTATPGWARLGVEARQRLVQAARRYLAEAALPSLRWLGTSTHYRPAAAAYRALRLLQKERPDQFEALPATVWATWAAALIGVFDNDAGAAESIQAPMVARAYAAAPRALGRALARLAWGPQSEGLTRRTFDLLEKAYDPDLGRALVRLGEGPHAGTFKGDKGLLNGFLVAHDYNPVIAQLSDWLAAPPAPQEAESLDAREGWIEAAGQLLHMGREAVWRQVLDLPSDQAPLARAIWARAVSDVFRQGATPLAGIDAELLGRAYETLLTLFPPPTEEASGARFLTAVDFAERLRNTLLNHLVARGEIQSVETVARLARADASIARFYLPEARRVYRGKTVGHDPRQVLERIEQQGVSYPLQDAVEAARQARAPSPSIPTGSDPTTTAILAGDLSPQADPGTAPKVRSLSFVAVATEWLSAHGGVSTLNRELCSALAELGHNVRCVVLDADEAARSAATAAGVKLIVCPTAPGIDDPERLLLLRLIHFGGEAPDIVFGHDQVTGAYARVLATELGCAYAHFLHTVPEEIEPHKTRSATPNRGTDKRKAQRRLAKEAQLIVAIGPLIRGDISYADDTPVHEMIPGLNVELLAQKQKIPLNYRLHLAGRMEDAELKGLPLAGAVILGVVQAGVTSPQAKLVIRGLDPAKNDEQMRKTGLGDVDRANCLIGRSYTADPDEILDDLRQASLVLMPSRSEGFGLTGFEAIAAGLPVLITKQSGLALWLIDLEAAGAIDAGFAEACIASPYAPGSSIETVWTDKAAALLSDRHTAFARAEALRQALAGAYTWSSAAQAFVVSVITALERKDENPEIGLGGAN